MANPTAPVGPKKTPSKRGRKRKVDAGDLTVFADREAQLYAERLINMETLARPRHPAPSRDGNRTQSAGHYFLK